MTTSESSQELPTIHQVSAGGVVFRESNGNIEVVIIKTSSEKRWQLPKGLIDAGETVEEAAIREVREESGLNSEILEPAHDIEYWFTAAYDGQRRRYHKMVHFFLMKFVSGSVEDHDHEVAESRWVPIGEAIKMLEFKSEQDVVRVAAEKIPNHIKND